MKPRFFSAAQWFIENERARRGGIAASHTEVSGKMVFGGLGFNVFNPALVGRAFLQAAFPVAITTYTTLGRLVDKVQSVDLLAVDEAHAVKNPETQRTQAVVRMCGLAN